MSILITYPKQKIAPYYRLELAQTTDVFYHPLRHLVARQLTAQAIEQLVKAQNLVLTSPFAVEVFKRSWAIKNPTATLHVLSHLQAQQLAQLPNPIKVSPAENRRALAASLTTADQVDLCWLLGDLALPHYQNYHGNKVVLYENRWGQAEQGKLLLTLLQHRIQKVVLTSTSAAQRFLATLGELDSEHQYLEREYYVLGRQTGDYLTGQGLTVKYPTSDQQVLDNVMQRLVKEEHDHAREV